MPRRTATDDTTIETTDDTDSGPVANPPAGGDQTQASTNDDNQNTVLRTEPHLVVSSDRDTAGVVSRFTSAADAENDAAARRKTLEDAGVTGTKFTVLPESELPDFVAKVEAGEEV